MKTQKEIFTDWKSACKSYSTLVCIIQNEIPEKLTEEEKLKLKKDLEMFRKEAFSYQIVFNKMVMDINTLFVSKGII